MRAWRILYSPACALGVEIDRLSCDILDVIFWAKYCVVMSWGKRVSGRRSFIRRNAPPASMFGARPERKGVQDGKLFPRMAFCYHWESSLSSCIARRLGVAEDGWRLYTEGRFASSDGRSYPPYGVSESTACCMAELVLHLVHTHVHAYNFDSALETRTLFVMPF